MADQKASVVLGAAFVMATIVFGDLASAAGDAALEPARLTLLVTALGSGILAAIALTPRLASGVSEKHPLFFASIARMERDEYHDMMSELLRDDSQIYHAIIDDLHAASSVLLQAKYRPLQASYAVLVVGMILTFVVALVTA